MALSHALVVLAHSPQAGVDPYRQSYFLSSEPREALTQLLSAAGSFLPDIGIAALLPPDDVDPNALYE